MKITVLITCFLSLMFSNCATLKEEVLIEDIKNSKWEQSVNLQLENEDTVSLRNIIFLMRYDNTFKYNTLKFSFSVTSPSGDTFCDTVRVDVPETNDTYITILNLEQTIVKNVKFDSCGTYSFEINPLLSLPLEGVIGVGLALGEE
ncbi:MAG: hypothetical protein R3Y51_01175 [Rikenellaceae bacterium]